MYKGVFSNIKNRLLQELIPHKLKHTEIEAFRTGNKTHFDTTWGNFQYYWKAQIPLNYFFATLRSDSVKEKRLKISQTPHFKYAMHYLGYIENYNFEYESYILQYFPENCLDERKEAFDWIIENSKLNISSYNKNSDPCALLRMPLTSNENLVLIDGLHRCSALAALGKKSVVVGLLF